MQVHIQYMYICVFLRAWTHSHIYVSGYTCKAIYKILESAVLVYLIVGTENGLNSAIRSGSIGTQTRPKTQGNVMQTDIHDFFTWCLLKYHDSSK